MAKAFLSTAHTILPLQSSSSSTTTATSKTLYSLTNNVKRSTRTHCKAATEGLCKQFPILTKRNLAINLTTIIALSLAGKGGFFHANAAILEAEDDADADKKKRIEKQALIDSSPLETAYLQELVYKLSKVGKSLEDRKLGVASSVLGPSTKTDWLQRANKAFAKLSSSPEQQAQVDAFNSSLSLLITTVAQRDVFSSKVAFVSSVGALENWAALTGLAGQLNGL